MKRWFLRQSAGFFPPCPQPVCNWIINITKKWDGHDCFSLDFIHAIMSLNKHQLLCCDFPALREAFYKFHCERKRNALSLKGLLPNFPFSFNGNVLQAKHHVQYIFAFWLVRGRHGVASVFSMSCVYQSTARTCSPLYFWAAPSPSVFDCQDMLILPF